jgi:O-antigen/teichoic acid export membrane protein
MDSLLRELKRYRGIFGSFGFSAANFVLAFALQKHFTPSNFGVFAMVQVYLQFGMSLSNALFCSPILHETDREGRLDPNVTTSYARANLIACITGAVLVAAVSAAHIISLVSFTLIAVLMVIGWSRWFYRAVELAEHNTLAPFLADVYYAVVVTVGAVLVIVTGWLTLDAALLVLIAGSAAAMASLSLQRLREMALIIRAPMTPFRKAFARHGRWSLIGVLTTEATSNGYAYLITAVMGPAAYAPIAAINLFFRPVTVVIQALTQYERPRMVRAVGDGHTRVLLSEIARFRLVVVLASIGNFLLVLGALLFGSRMIGNEEYDPAQFITASFILGAIYLVRSLRAGESAALQALAAFRPLAWITVYTAPISVGLVIVALQIWPHAVTYTLFGVLISEIVGCIMIHLLLRNTLHHASAPA